MDIEVARSFGEKIKLHILKKKYHLPNFMALISDIFNLLMCEVR